MKLLDRIILQNILPREGNIRTLTIVKDIQKKIELTQSEFKDFDIQVLADGKITWNKEANEMDFDILFSELETIEIKLILKKLDKEKKISIDMFGLIKLFKVEAE